MENRTQDPRQQNMHTHVLAHNCARPQTLYISASLSINQIQKRMQLVWLLLLPWQARTVWVVRARYFWVHLIIRDCEVWKNTSNRNKAIFSKFDWLMRTNEVEKSPYMESYLRPKSFMAWLNGICDNLVELDVANQAIKNETIIFSSHFLIFFLFASPLPPLASPFLPSPLYSLSLPASPHLPILHIYWTPCTEWRICLLILIPHTKGGWIISFLSHPAWIGPLRNSHAMAFFLKADC